MNFNMTRNPINNKTFWAMDNQWHSSSISKTRGMSTRKLTIARRDDNKSDNTRNRPGFRLWIMARANFIAVSSAVKIDAISGSLRLETDSHHTTVEKTLLFAFDPSV